MGLIKNIDSVFGITATYHSVSVTNIDWDNKRGDIAVRSFLSKEAKLNGKMFLDETIYRFDTELFPFTRGGNTEAEAYAYISTQEKFADAIDDI